MRKRLTEQWIVADPETFDAVVAALRSSELERGHADRRTVEKTTGAVVGSEQRAYFLL